MNRKKVLIIDDDPDICQSVIDVLEIKGYHPVATSGGQQGIEYLKSMLEQPCVILLDIIMPVATGRQVMDFLKQDPLFAHIPVIVFSEFAGVADSVRSVAFVPKPIEMKSLINAVKAFCD